MKHPVDALREALHLQAGDRLEPLHTVPPPAMEPVHAGFAQPEPPALTALLAEPLPTLRPVELLPGVRAAPYALDPGVVALASELDLDRAFGVALPTPSGWTLDARREPAAIRVSARASEHVVVVWPGGEIAVYALHRPTAIDAWTPPRLPDPPTVAALLDGCSCAPEIAERVEQLAGDGLDAVARVGTLLRLWRPATHAELLATARTAPPVARARAWAAGLDERALSRIGRHALAAADALAETLDEPGDHTERALTIADRRDRLASVFEVLAVQAAEAPLGRALAAFDSEAMARISELPPAGTLAHVGWLHAVGVADPDAWWAGWARP